MSVLSDDHQIDHSIKDNIAQLVDYLKCNPWDCLEFLLPWNCRWRNGSWRNDESALSIITAAWSNGWFHRWDIVWWTFVASYNPNTISMQSQCNLRQPYERFSDNQIISMQSQTTIWEIPKQSCIRGKLYSHAPPPLLHPCLRPNTFSREISMYSSLQLVVFFNSHTCSFLLWHLDKLCWMRIMINLQIQSHYRQTVLIPNCTTKVTH